MNKDSNTLPSEKATEQNQQNGDSEQITQLEQMNEIEENDENQLEIDDEAEKTKKLLGTSIDKEELINSKVYKETCTKIEKNPHLISSMVGSLTSLKSTKKNRSAKCRTILWYVTFMGFMVNYLIRINVNIAIVEMVGSQQKNTVDYHTSECIQSVPILNSTSVAINQIALINSNKFDWDAKQQSQVLGSFFYFHWVFPIPGGFLAPRYATKLIFGLSNYISCVLCIFIPIVAKMHVDYLIALRIIQGMIAGFAWPSMHHLTAQWIPPNERSKFLTSYMGSSVGVGIFYPIFGFILSMWPWESVFYVTAIFGTVWYALWLYFVYDSPDQHPHIDPSELLYIKESLSDSVHAGKIKKTPWKSILTSVPIWVNIIGQYGGVWGIFTRSTFYWLRHYSPTYFRVVHGCSLQMTGVLSGVPHFTRMIFSYVFSIFADSLLKNNTMSRTNVRKMASNVAVLVQSLFLIALAFTGCNSTAAFICLLLALTSHGAISSGQLPAMIDMSPNFSGILMGLTSMVLTTPGFISPYLVGYLTLGNQSIQQWQYVFLISGAVLIVTGTVYLLFGDATLQSWNQPTAVTIPSKEEEIVDMKNTTSNDLIPLKESNDVTQIA